MRTSPQEIYQEYNRGYPDIGWFIPPGFYESEEEYKLRAEGIKELVKGEQFYAIKHVIEKFWIPRTNFRSFQQWSANQMLPRMNHLCPSKIFSNQNKRDFMVGWLIDIGWDPNHNWVCIPPDEPYDEIKIVVDGMWDILNHKTYPMIKNEYYRLFHNNSHRYVQFVDMVDKTIPRNQDELATFMVTREKMMVSHLIWLAKTDVRVFDYFKDRIFKNINHEIALSMAINDPLMTEEERVRRDLMLITQPVHNEYLTRNEGHNRIRDSIVGEHVQPKDYKEVKDGLTKFYFREDNQYMEQYLMQRYMYYLDHPDKAKDMIDRLVDLPYKVTINLNEKYGKFNYEIIAAVCEAAMTCYSKAIRKPRWSKDDAVNHTLELLRDMYPAIIRVQGRVDPTGYEKIIDETDMNIIGAIRVIMSDDDAKKEYGKLARRFGSQDSRHNPKIVELMTEIATDTVNRVQVEKKFDIKEPQHILLRKEQPRNPRDMVTNYFEYHNDTNDDMCENDTFDVVTNENDVDGHTMAKFFSVEDERKIIRDKEAKALRKRNQVMEDYHVDRLGDAMERYLPDLKSHKLNYVGHKDRDLFKSTITERRRKKDNRQMEEMVEKYDLTAYVDDDEEDGIDLSNATPDEIATVVEETFTKTGKDYIKKLLTKFDLEANSEYDEINSDEMLNDRIELLRSNVEEIIDSCDPIYIQNGLGEKGTFVPEDVEMTNKTMIDMIEWMDSDEMEDFINNYVDDKSRKKIMEMIRRGYTIDDVRDLLISNADELVRAYDEEDEEEEEYPMDELKEHIKSILYSMDKDELITLVKNVLDDDDRRRLLRLIDAKMHLNDIRNRILNLLINEYNPEYLIEIFVDNTEDDEDETSDSDDLYDRYNRVINSGASLYSFMQEFMEDREFESIIRTLDDAGGTLNDAKEVAWEMITKRNDPEDIESVLNQYDDTYDEDDHEDDEDDDIIDKKVFLDKLKSRLRDLDRRKLIEFIQQYFDSTDTAYLMKFRREPNLYLRVFNCLVDNYDIDDIIDTLNDDDDDAYYYEDNDEYDEDDGKFHFNWDSFQREDDTLRDALIQKIGTTDNIRLTEEKRAFYDWMIDNGITFDMSDDELKRTIARMNSLDFKKFTEHVEKILRTNSISNSRTTRSRFSHPDLGRYNTIVDRMSKINVSSNDDEEEEETDELAERRFRRALYAR